MLERREFFAGLSSALAAPVIIRTPGLLMPVKPVSLLHCSITYDPYCPPGEIHVWEHDGKLIATCSRIERPQAVVHFYKGAGTGMAIVASAWHEEA